MFRMIWKFIDTCRRFLLNILFIVFFIFFISLFFMDHEIEVEQGAALVLSPAGNIVEQKSYADPSMLLLSRMMGEEEETETLLKDVIDVVDFAAKDEKIKVMVLDFGKMGRVDICKIQDIGAALVRFKNAGKRIIAFGDSYSQNQYYLAAHADEVYLHPFGGIFLTGYGVFRVYFKEALDKLMVKFHAFKVGTYKSALEPFIRDDMSEEAKLANLDWLNNIWKNYKDDVAAQRALQAKDIDRYINDMAVNLEKVQGDTAELALAHQLVDGLKTDDEIRDYYIEKIGPADHNANDYKQIRFNDYLKYMRQMVNKKPQIQDKIGIIVAKGLIMGGKQAAGNIGSDTLSAMIAQARDDDTIKAVVLRIDSGGGSSFASEVIRREVELVQEAGKPVIVSMGSIAASGGYWIAATADEIWASRSTITGSIGVFGAFATFDESMNDLGLHSDGVGTTLLSNAFDPSRPINPMFADIMTQMIENTYSRFLGLVAKGRGMSVQDVDKIAQGRVWAGRTALELGLVDRLGNLDDAVKAAAERAGLDVYESIYVTPPLTPKEQLMKELSEYMVRFAPKLNEPVKTFAYFQSVFNGVQEFINQMNDPRGVYAQCLVCYVQ